MEFEVLENNAIDNGTVLEVTQDFNDWKTCLASGIMQWSMQCTQLTKISF